MGKKHRAPTRPDDGFRRAVSLHQAGRLAEAEQLYRSLPPGDANVLQLLGVLCYQSGRQDEGLRLLTQAIEIKPDHAEALSNLGVIQHERKDFAGALFSFERAIKLLPGSADLLNKHGFVLQDLGRDEEAVQSFRLAVAEDKNFAEAYLNLGNSLQTLGQLDEAETAFRKTIALRPMDADALTNLGSVLAVKREVQQAADVLRRAIEIHPTANAYHNLARALSGLGKRDEAIRAAQTAVQLEPKQGTHRRLLGSLFEVSRQLPAAIAAFQKTLELDPADNQTGTDLGAALNQDGRFDEALAVLNNLPNPTPGAKMVKALLVPVIPMTTDEIEAGRMRVLTELGKLAQEDIRIVNPMTEVSVTNFFWSYHHATELPMQRAAVEVYRKACPDLDWIAPHCREPRAATGKIRVGVCSALLNRHTIGKLFIRLLAGLKDDDIEVVYLDTALTPDDWTQKLIQGVDVSYKLATDWRTAREFIAEQKLDALFYPDIGMDPQSYYLAYSRLAPLQFMTWGHPVSTGLPHMDCFLSSEDLEREGSEVDYSERLVKFQELMTVFTRPEDPKVTRTDLGLPEDKHLYVCPQVSFKLHPDFDRVFAEILRRDPQGLVVLITGTEKHWDELLRQRFAKVMPDVADRIVFMDRLSTEHYIGLNGVADAVLDTFYFGGGNSSLEGFSVGAPIVTLPGQMLRGRITLTQYRKMGIDRLIARDPDHYIELALELGQDKAWRTEMSRLILERCPVLYDNPKPIEELRAFLRRECAR